MTNQEYWVLLGLCLLILLLQLLILGWLMKRYLPQIPRPVIRWGNFVFKQPTQPTDIEENYDEVFVQNVAQNDGYISEFNFQDSFFQATNTSDQGTA